MSGPEQVGPPAQLTRYESGAGGVVSYRVEGYGRQWVGSAPAGTSPLELLLKFTIAHAPAGAEIVTPLLRALLPALSGDGSSAGPGGAEEAPRAQRLRPDDGTSKLPPAQSPAAQSPAAQSSGLTAQVGQLLGRLSAPDRAALRAAAAAIQRAEAVGPTGAAAFAAGDCVAGDWAAGDCAAGDWVSREQDREGGRAGDAQSGLIPQPGRPTAQLLSAREAQLSAVVQHMQDAIVIRDLHGRFILVNPQAERNLGAPASALLGSRFGDLGSASGLSPARLEESRSVEAQVIASGCRDVREMSWPEGNRVLTLHVTTFPYWVQDAIHGTVCVARDISAQRQLERSLRLNAAQLQERVRARTLSLERLSRRLRHAAVHDALTGLPNRNLFIERLQEVISRRVRYPEQRFAVFFLDFDRFKFVNDSLGHAAGDALLLQIAARLKEAAPAATTLSRFGGDEFVLLIEQVADAESARRHAEALVRLFHAPFNVQRHELRLTVSVGVTCCDHPLGGTSEVVQEADLAMYRAKADGRGRYVLFEPHMRERQTQLLELQSDLGLALRRGELRVHYQPTVRGDQFSGGVEALVRWQHPQYGLIPPNDFIMIAEERGLIRELDLWVLRQACQELLHLNGEHPTLGVNFSASHFEHPDLLEQVERILWDTGFPGHRLIFEITERLLLRSNAAALDTLERLRARGIQIAIDDFGTGYSALSYLQRLPVDILKIDRSFVNAVAHDPAIVRSIIEMAHTLQLRVVAEGVETREQAEILGALNCDYLQGYLFARPLPFPDLQRWIAAGDPRWA